MKKVSRILSFAVVCVLLCVSLCSCADIEEMRSHQAFLNEDGTITYKGVSYSLVDVNGDINYKADDVIYITPPDVPVLLSAAMGDWAYASDDGHVIEYGGTYYCSEEKYDEITQKFNGKIVFDSYCYNYYDIESDKTKTYILTDTQKAAVDMVLKNESAKAAEEDMYKYDTVAYLEKCSEDGLFIGDSVGELCVENDSYYILVYGDRDTEKYIVPEEYADVFAEIMKHIIEAEKI